MPRIPRVVALNYPHHVTIRGNNRENVFLYDDDCNYYLKLLKKYSTKYNCLVWAYCLMTNHVHMLLIPKGENSLAKCLQGISLCYTQYFNLKYKRTGRLWESRYYSCIVDKENYLWEVVKYIERNPVRANIVNSIEEYHWSSARSHLFGWPDEILIGDDWLAERDRVRYGQFLKDSKKDKEEIIRKSTRSGKPLGTANFISTIEKLLDRDLQSKRHGKPSVGKR